MRTKILLCAILALSLTVSYSQAEIDPDRIVGIWLLDEGKGDVAKDASENGREGTITNAKWAKGKFDGALEIKKGGTVTIPLGKGIIEDKVTFILWLRCVYILTPDPVIVRLLRLCKKLSDLRRIT